MEARRRKRSLYEVQMKLITFSLWGSDPKYLKGALKNAELAKSIYPEWKCRFYIAQSVPFSVIYELEEYDNVEVIKKQEWGDWSSMFWRFEPASDPDVEVMISRDADSRLNHREKAAVDEWIASSKGLHIMRDHPWHKYYILGGMWGVKAGALPNMKRLLEEWQTKNEYGNDYLFFSKIISPIIRNNTMVHDEFFAKIPFPTKRQGDEYVGQVFNENDETVSEHTKALEGWLTRDAEILKTLS